MASLVKEEQVLLRNFFLFGICFGLCFPLMALGIDFWVKDLSFSVNNIVKIHFTNPIHFIIDSAPIILSFTAYMIGRMVIFRERKTKLKLERALKRTKQFYHYTTHLLEGNFDELDIDDSEEFQSLLILKEKIMLSRQNEQESLWGNNALQEISKVVRENKSSKKDLCRQLLAKMAKCIRANMGMMYVKLADVEKDSVLAVAGYAQNANVPLLLEIEAGEGLVGQCFVEKKTIHLTQIPKDYLTIDSGLGSRKPDTLVLAPLVFNDQVFGVIELACFGKVQAYKLEFVNKAAEFIAYTFSYTQLCKSDFEQITQLG